MQSKKYPPQSTLTIQTAILCSMIPNNVRPYRERVFSIRPILIRKRACMTELNGVVGYKYFFKLHLKSNKIRRVARQVL